jgi:predicted amino acid-binding ACT domain protein
MSTGSEKNIITSVVPAGALDVKLGIVSSVKGCAAANGIEIDDIINRIIRNFCI